MYQLCANCADGIKQYGIQGKTVKIANITASQEEINMLLQQCIRCNVSELHLADIVEDWFGRTANSF